MTQTDNSSRDGDSLSMAARLFWLVLIIATLYLCYFHNLGAIGLVGPDEPRYAWIAREMHESGDWVTPRLYGQPWFEKPVLYYWGAALSFKLFGVSEAAARFPSAFAALLATLAMAWLAWRVYGPWTARWLFLLLPTTVGMIGFSHAAATDMPFAATLTIAMVFAARILGLVPPTGLSLHAPNFSLYTNTRPRGLVSLLFFGLFLGLATLAKGPAAVALSGGGVLLWAAFTRRWRDAFRCLHPVAIASFCLTALPWYIICSRRNPDFFRIFVIEHNFKRYLTPEFQHIQPFWYYVPILLIAFAPWTLALVWSALFGALHTWPQRRPSDATLLALCWVVFCLLFFSFSKSKLPGYILPAVPAIGLLLSRVYVRLVPQEGWTFRLLLLTGAIPMVLLAPVLWSLYFGRPGPTASAATGSGWVWLLFGIANFLLAARKTAARQPFALASLSVVPILAILLFFNHLAPLFLPWDPSGKTLAQDLRTAQIPPEQTYAAAMPRGQQFSLSFYLHQEIQTWDQNQPKEGYLLLPFKARRFPVKSQWTCSTDPVVLPASGWFAYKIQREDSVSRRHDGSGPDGSSPGGSGPNRNGLAVRSRQPR
ncbi:MAG: glycosyltransferase family 39 protein [Candidatus Acidiferrum sp.]